MKLEIRHYKGTLDFFNMYEFKIVDSDNKVILSDSIEDEGQGINIARDQIHEIIKRKGFIK